MFSFRLAPLESSDSSGGSSKKKRLTKKRRKQKPTILSSKIEEFSSEDDEFDQNLSTKFEDDGFGSYESNSSSKSLFFQVGFVFLIYFHIRLVSSGQFQSTVREGHSGFG